MTNLTGWMTPDVMQPLGWTLLHFLWQGLALAAMAAAVMSLFRSAVVRYWIGVAVLAAMVVAVVATFVVLRDVARVDARMAERAGVSVGSEIRAGLAESEGMRAVKAAAHTMQAEVMHRASRWGESGMPSNSLLFLVEAWFAGVMFFSLRTVGGFVMIERMRRKDALCLDPALMEMCRRLQRRLKLDRAIRYLECTWLEAPSVIGWFRPVVMLPVAAVTGLSEEQLEAVIAHELAHIQRLDSFVNVAQIAVESVLFYHPAVWWLNRVIRAERENCCDDTAIALCGNRVEYARALTMMETWRLVPGFAMAVNRGSVTARITRLLGIGTSGNRMRSVGLASSVLCLTAALVAGNAFVGTVATKAAGQAPASAADAAPVTPAGRGAKVSHLPAPPAPAAVATALPAPAPVAAPNAESEPQAAPAAPDAHASSSYIDGLKSEGLTNLGVDLVIAMKIQGVTPEYVRGIHEQGLHPDAEELIAMKVQGVTPEYIRDLKAKGLQLSDDRVIAMKVQGVTPEYVAGLQSLGMQMGPDELIAMKVQGVTPDYIRAMNGLGMKLTAQQAVATKVQGITPDYLRGMHDLGLQPNVSQLIGMKVQGITPDYVRQMKALGLLPSIDQLIGMKVQGVDPGYVKGMQGQGLMLDAEQLISARIQGVTPEFVERAKRHGFQNLNIDKLIQLKQTGVLGEQADL
jgi:beta-lactamase regulating signal transducer with metallopeptidase domain